MNERQQRQFNVERFNEERLSTAYKAKITDIKNWPLIGPFALWLSNVVNNYSTIRPTVEAVQNNIDQALGSGRRSLGVDAIGLFTSAFNSLKGLIYGLPMSVLQFVEDLYLTIHGKVKTIGHLPAGLSLVFRGINWANTVLGTALGGVAVYLGLSEFLSKVGLSITVPGGLAASLLPIGIAGIATFATLVTTIKTGIEWAYATTPEDKQNLKSKFFQNLTTFALVAAASVLTIALATNPVALLIVAVSSLVLNIALKQGVKKIFPEYKVTSTSLDEKTYDSVQNSLTNDVRNASSYEQNLTTTPVAVEAVEGSEVNLSSNIHAFNHNISATTNNLTDINEHDMENGTIIAEFNPS